MTEFTFLVYNFRRRKLETKITNDLFDGLQQATNQDVAKLIKQEIKGEWPLSRELI